MVKEKKDYVDLIFIFKHKGKYLTNICSNDGSSNAYNRIIEYIFESEEEWGDKRFDFAIDDYDIMDKLEYLSHKDLEFEAKNREKLSFKFKPDSKISVSSILLRYEEEEEVQEKLIKYYSKGLNLDIDVIFNKKGKYTLSLYFKDLSLNNKEYSII